MSSYLLDLFSLGLLLSLPTLILPNVSFCLQMCIVLRTYGYDLEGLSRYKTDFDLL